MTPELRRLRHLLGRGLLETRDLWPDIRQAFGWVHQAAHILKNEAGLAATAVETRFDALLADLAQGRAQAGTLAGTLDRFLKVTTSYRPGLFHCYRVPGLPATNNALEQSFGSPRRHERRVTGRKRGSPSLVVRGPARFVAATATRLRPFTARDLARLDLQRWRDLRRRLDDRRQPRTLGTRFRRNPQAYLDHLEHQALQQTLPA